MGLRPARVYRDWKRPYTRVAPTKPNKSYIKGVPGSKLHLYEVGKPNPDFDLRLNLVPEQGGQVRHNALEAGRVACAAYLRKTIEEKNFFLKVRVIPHQVLREHAQAAIAQADRFYDGMSHPFGKPSGVAARIKAGQPLYSLSVRKTHKTEAKEALRRAAAKIPMSCSIVEE